MGIHLTWPLEASQCWNGTSSNKRIVLHTETIGCFLRHYGAYALTRRHNNALKLHISRKKCSHQSKCQLHDNECISGGKNLQVVERVTIG